MKFDAGVLSSNAVVPETNVSAPKAVFFDLWVNHKGEVRGTISEATYHKLRDLGAQGMTLVPLGKWQQKALTSWNWHPYEVVNLPHPAARDKLSHATLVVGLAKLYLDGKSVVLIGGEPKGHSIPFHPATYSARRLIPLVKDLGFLLWPSMVADMFRFHEKYGANWG